MTIKKGDLVMVVKPTPCCGRVDSIGKVFVAHDIAKCEGKTQCCNMVYVTNVVFDGTTPSGGWCSNRLIKLNPPSDEETTHQTKELEHTA